MMLSLIIGSVLSYYINKIIGNNVHQIKSIIELTMSLSLITWFIILYLITS